MQQDIDKVIIAVNDNIDILKREQEKHGYAFRVDMILGGKSLRFRFDDGFELEI